jgi:hypothetical protein
MTLSTSADANEYFIWPTTFSSTLFIGDGVLPNEYCLTVGMMPLAGQTVSSEGMKKIKGFITKFVQNSIIIRQDHQLLKQLYHLNTNILQLPQDPHDYLLANVLFHKLTAISRNHFTIRQITIDSSIGDRVKYQVNDSCTTYDKILKTDSWWNQDNVKTNNTHKFPSWKDLDITAPNRFSPKIVKGGRDENKSIQRTNI